MISFRNIVFVESTEFTCGQNTDAFVLEIDHVFPSVHEIELWALNEAARAFWQSVGYNIVGKQKQKMRCHHHTKETPAYIQWAVFSKTCIDVNVLFFVDEIVEIRWLIKDG